ncbi:glyoxalase [Histoplasma ohiense]|nr:glyoxalase [Histoplasma ohiense (nom. inval.)]
MPVAHLTLTVSHLPTSTSFFLSCLQPLGYRFIGRHDNNVGFGSVPGEPADFWIAEERPGVPAGAAHVAFPAPSRDAVSQFFIAALKAGAKIHGEPTLRDAEQNYYSAAVIDFDGNSIEAVHRPKGSGSGKTSADRALTIIKTGSVISKASSTKTESVVRAKAEIGSYVSKAKTAVSKPAAASASPQSKAPPSIQLQQQPVPQSKDSTNGAKAVVGTLLGAAAGAAIAYSIFKSDSSEPTPAQHQYVEQPVPAFAPAPEPTVYRAIEAAPARSMTFGGIDNEYADYARTMLSKNPRASTIMDGLENCSRIWDQTRSVGGGSDHEYHAPRRASSASVYSGMQDMDIPIRAIEAVPFEEGSECSYSYPRKQPSTFVSSFKERPYHYDDNASAYSSSTLKAPSKTHSHCNHSTHSRPSSHHSHSSRSTRSIITIKDIHSSSKSSTPTASIYSTTHSARNIPLPSGSITTISTSSSRRQSRDHHSTHGGSSPTKHHRHQSSSASSSPTRSHHSSSKHSHAHSHASYANSPRHMPLPDSVAGASTIFLEGVDVDSHVTPVAASRASTSRRSTRSSKFDEPVRPSDSVSQVSTNVSKKSSRSSRR